MTAIPTIQLACDFAGTIHQFARRPLPATIQTPVGRAFTVSARPFIGPIHTGLVSESHADHSGHLEQIKASRRFKGSIYAGAGGLVNLSYVAASNVSAALLFDINPLQKIFWDKLVEKLAKHDNPDDCIDAIGSIYTEIEDETQNVVGSIEAKQLFRGLKAPRKSASTKRKEQKFTEFVLSSWNTPATAWLENEKLYERLHRLAQENRIGAATIDVMDTQGWNDLRTDLDAHYGADAKIALLYLSNIPGFYDSRRSGDFVGRQVMDEAQSMIEANTKLCMAPGSQIIACHDTARGSISMYKSGVTTSRRRPKVGLDFVAV